MNVDFGDVGEETEGLYMDGLNGVRDRPDFWQSICDSRDRENSGKVRMNRWISNFFIRWPGVVKGESFYTLWYSPFFIL